MNPLNVGDGCVEALTLAATFSGPPLVKLTNRSLGLLEAIVIDAALVALANRAPFVGSVAMVPPPLSVPFETVPLLNVKVAPVATWMVPPPLRLNDLLVVLVCR